MLHQGAWLTSVSCLDFLLCESCQSWQTDRQRDRQAGRQAAHSVEQKHQELSGCHGYTPGVSLLLSLCMLSACVHVCVWVYFGRLKAGHYIKKVFFCLFLCSEFVFLHLCHQSSSKNIGGPFCQQSLAFCKWNSFMLT